MWTLTSQKSFHKNKSLLLWCGHWQVQKNCRWKKGKWARSARSLPSHYSLVVARFEMQAAARQKRCWEKMYASNWGASACVRVHLFKTENDWHTRVASFLLCNFAFKTASTKAKITTTLRLPLNHCRSATFLLTWIIGCRNNSGERRQDALARSFAGLYQCDRKLFGVFDVDGHKAAWLNSSFKQQNSRITQCALLPTGHKACWKVIQSPSRTAHGAIRTWDFTWEWPHHTVLSLGSVVREL